MLNPQLQAKFLLHLNNRKKNNEEGFTLIELLVVIIIIGILAAIALPSLLGQVNKAKQAEAKNYVGVSNRSQQAYYLEYQNFATSISQLQVGIKTQTDNYSYTIVSQAGSNSAAISFAVFTGTAIKNALKSYYGSVGTTTGNDATSEALTLAIACESLTPTQTAFAAPATYSTACDAAYTSLAR